MAEDQRSEWIGFAVCMAMVLVQQRMATTGVLSAAADLVDTRDGIPMDAGEQCEEQVKNGVKR